MSPQPEPKEVSQVTANNINTDIEDLKFHLEQDPNVQYIVLRTTNRAYSPADLDAITANVAVQTGAKLSWREVPQTEHNLANEVIVEFTNNKGDNQ
jgi:hypothetical protein